MSIHTRTLSMKHHQPPPDASGQHCRCSSTTPPFLLSTMPPTLFSSSLSCPAAPLSVPPPQDPPVLPLPFKSKVVGVARRSDAPASRAEADGAAGAAWFPLALLVSNLSVADFLVRRPGCLDLFFCLDA
jgi:hypothetical protein